MKSAADAKRILIVDDEPDIVLAVQTVLEDAGYQVASVDRGDRLMNQLSAGEVPDLIVLDMLLSGRDGREIARELKAQPHTHQIPILMLSAHPAALREAHDAGADAFLAKPFELDDLLETVAKCLGR
ncbi:MAG TPA: response regulator [Ktedonobacterales bacterium]|nr:response regulator [Ktedonobacterales bacterium]